MSYTHNGSPSDIPPVRAEIVDAPDVESLQFLVATLYRSLKESLRPGARTSLPAGSIFDLPLGEQDLDEVWLKSLGYVRERGHLQEPLRRHTTQF